MLPLFVYYEWTSDRLSSRLHRRVRPLGAAYLSHHRLRYTAQGGATVIAGSLQDRVLGLVYRVTRHDLQILDNDPDVTRVRVLVDLPTGEQTGVYTYLVRGPIQTPTEDTLRLRRRVEREAKQWLRRMSSLGVSLACPRCPMVRVP